MPRHVAFLRAINVGGHHVVPMPRLKQLFEGLGFGDVETFIASGNVIFSATGTPRSLEKRIGAHLERSLGYEVATFLRSPVALGAVCRHPAFPKSVPDSTLYIGFLADAPTAAARKQVAALANDIDEFHLHDRELYWRCRLTIGRSTMNGARLEKALGQPTTLRKVSTLEKLAARYCVA